MITILGNVGSGEATNTDTLDITLTADVPVSTASVGIGIAAFFTVAAYGPINIRVPDDAFTYRDTATDNPLYSAVNGVSACVGASNGSRDGSVWEVGFACQIVAIVNGPLHAGDIVSLSKAGGPHPGPVDVIHASLFAFSGGITGGCNVFEDVPTSVGLLSSGAIDASGCGSIIDAYASPDATRAFYVAGELGAVSPALSFQDGAVSILDSWSDIGPNGDISMICGTRAIGAPGANYDIGACTDIPPVSALMWGGFGAVFLSPQPGPGYCAGHGIHIAARVGFVPSG